MTQSGLLRIDGSKLYRRRIEKGLSLRDLASRCAAAGRSISDGQLSRLEKGRSGPPRAGLWPALTAALGCTIDDLALNENGQDRVAVGQ